MMKIKKSLALILSVGMLFSFASCGDSLSGFELGHFDGSDTSKGYDSDLLYQNTSEFLGGDSGVIWVSEEDDPEYGGYFYQYMSECASVNNGGTPSDENGDIAHSLLMPYIRRILRFPARRICTIGSFAAY